MSKRPKSNENAMFQILSTPMVGLAPVELSEVRDGEVLRILQRNKAFEGLSLHLLDSEDAVAESVAARTFEGDPFIPMKKIVVVIGPRKAPILLHHMGKSAGGDCDFFEVEANCFAFYTTINTNPFDGSWMWYPLHNVEYMNDLFWGVIGVTEKPLPMHSPLSWKDQLHAPDVRAAVDTFTKYVESAGKQPYSCIVHYKSGSSDELVSIWCRGVASIWKEDMSAVLQMAGTHTDVSHLTQQATSKLMRMTHEVRTPLASIVGAFDVLDRAGAARKLSDDGTVWDILRSSIKQLRIIVDDVVKLSQISSGSVHLCPTRASLRSIIGNILGVMHGRTQALGQTISVDYQTDPDRTFLVDVDHVNIVLVNLISNACKYSPQGADVKLICSRTEDIYSILVKDKGIGIAPEEHEAVFEEFSRGSNAARGCSDVLVGPSAGIGLALSRWIGLALGGNVVVDSSELDRGTSMEFTFRAVEAGAGEITPQPTEQDWKSGYSCEDPLLVVDDVRPNRLLAERYLRSYGFENVELAASGAEAVEKAKRTRYAICLIDIHMPGHDGFWVIDKLLEHGYEKQRLILWTAAGDFDHVSMKSKQVGVGWLSKPLGFKAVRMISSICGKGAETGNSCSESEEGGRDDRSGDQESRGRASECIDGRKDKHKQRAREEDERSDHMKRQKR